LAAVDWDNSGHPNVTVPSGWTTIRQDGSTTDQMVALYYRFATASEPVSYTWFASMGVGFTGIIAAYSGVNPASPIELTAGQTGTASGATAPSLAAATSNDLLIAVWSTWNGDVRLSAPAGMITRQRFSGPDPIALADKPIPAAGPTGAQTASPSIPSGFWTGQLILLRSAP
jgi:hypothetical protein